MNYIEYETIKKVRFNSLEAIDDMPDINIEEINETIFNLISDQIYEVMMRKLAIK